MIASLVHIDSLSIVIMILVGFIGSIVLAFATRYLRYDRHYARFLASLSGLLVSVIILSVSDHVVLFGITWTLVNGILIRLMTHFRQWPQAIESGRQAVYRLGIGTAALYLGLILVTHSAHSVRISTIIHTVPVTPMSTIGIGCIVIAALAQSAIIPFHKWLLSSLNSPTPVSALMHAGIINGGGVLLTRFGPLVIQHPTILHFLVIIGLLTAAFGTAFKLVQSDIKRMLACSTMGQMGFMILQCGLGLFPAAISHMVWHGMFKAYFFLDSPSAAQYPKLSKPETPHPLSAIASIVGGMAAASIAMMILHISVAPINSSVVIPIVIGIAGTQGMMTFIQRNGVSLAPIGFGLAVVMGAMYGFSVRIVETTLRPLHLLAPQPFHWVHGMAASVLIGLWASIALSPLITKRKLPGLYVWILNLSQPHPATITSDRNMYRYD